MTRDAKHSTSDVVTVFARQGIAISTIARAMAIPADRVEAMCSRAKAADELHMMPPARPNDPRHALLSELTNLRAQLDEAQETIRQVASASQITTETYIGVAKLTRKEAAIVAAIVKHGSATKSAIYHALYGGLDHRDQREPKIVDVFVYKVRKKLRRFGIQIGTTWGTGYYMDAENLARFRALVKVPEVYHIDAPPLQAAISDMVAQ
jgi:two-component system cell cycle response regulator CtrA